MNTNWKDSGMEFNEIVNNVDAFLEYLRASRKRSFPFPTDPSRSQSQWGEPDTFGTTRTYRPLPGAVLAIRTDRGITFEEVWA